MKKVFTLLIIIISLASNAQEKSPVSWAYNIKKISSDEYELQVSAIIDKGWHLYGQYFEDGGPIKMKFEFAENNNVLLIDSVLEKPNPITKKDEIFDIDVQYFSGKVIFTQKVKIKKATEQLLKLEGQACNDKTGMCIMVADQHFFMLK